MLDQWVTESLCRHTIARVLFFSESFQRNIWAEKSKDEYSNNYKTNFKISFTYEIYMNQASNP